VPQALKREYIFSDVVARVALVPFPTLLEIEFLSTLLN